MRDLSWGTISSSWAGTGEPGRRDMVGSVWGHCSPSPLLWELPRGQRGRSQPLTSGVLQRDWQQENLQWRPSWGLDGAWLLPFLMCAGAREKMLPPTLRPQSGVRRGWEGSTHHSRLSPCLCRWPCAALLPVQPRHHCRGNKRH